MGDYRFIVLVCFAAGFLSGCGTYVPKIGEPWEKDYPGDPTSDPPTPALTASGQLELEIKKKVYCELRAAVELADHYLVEKTPVGKSTYRLPYIPNDWGAQISLSMEVDENTTLNPSAGIITPFHDPMTARTFGLGANISSTSSRTDKYNPYYSITALRDQKAPHMFCAPNSDPLVNDLQITPASSSFLLGNLGLREWLVDSMFVNQAIPSLGVPSSPVPAASPAKSPDTSILGSNAAATSNNKDGKKQPNSSGSSPKPDTVSIEIKFIVVSSGNFNPQWKLVRLSADSATSPLVSAGRTRTHDLIITLGPQDTQTSNANLALQIGQAVGAANRAALIGGAISREAF